MKRSVAALVFLFFAAMFIGIPRCFAQDQDNSAKSWQASVFMNATDLESFLFRLGTSGLIASPPRFLGYSMGGRLQYRFQKFSLLGFNRLGFEIFDTSLSASGPWMRKDDRVQENQVEGIAVGEVNLSVIGVGVEVERRFFEDSSLSPYIRLGPFGVGYLEGKFNGVFHGNLVGDPETKIEEPAGETFHQIVPVIGLGAGAVYKLSSHCAVSAGIGFNAGFYGEGALSYRW